MQFAVAARCSVANVAALGRILHVRPAVLRNFQMAILPRGNGEVEGKKARKSRRGQGEEEQVVL